ncbi:OmpA family protein [Uliginosibacterium sp. H1]|uniref:OmpA family protein n=1 Tax=Uliginosibacterium sp. H1 TaxID=3114757 RepID=UPI002E17D1CF|nr:OmpA family protein [Uliginosibacterium sp. H1]
MSSQDDDDNTRVALTFIGLIVAAVVVGVLTFAVMGLGSRPSAEAPEVELVIEEVDIAPVGEALVKVYYEIGQADLSGDAQAQLAKVVEAAAAQPTLIVLVSGFHDASGNAAQNAELAKQRALGVRQALLSAGVGVERVKLRKPESTLGDGQAAEARRVELRVQ